jgi:hypothetical protein
MTLKSNVQLAIIFVYRLFLGVFFFTCTFFGR